MQISDAPVTTLEREAAIRVMGENEVKASTNLSRVTRWRLERDGKFPQRVRLTGHRVGWLAEEIVQWIESRPRGGAEFRRRAPALQLEDHDAPQNA